MIKSYIFFLLLEITVIFIFYKTILSKKIITNRKILFEIVIFIKNYLKSIQYFLKIDLKKEIGQEKMKMSLVDKMTIYIWNILVAVAMLCLVPLIGVALVWGEVQYNKVLALFIFPMAEVIFIIGYLVDYIEKIINVLLEIFSYNRFFEKNGEKIYDKKGKIKWKNVFGIIIIIALSIIFVNVLEHLQKMVEDNKIFIAMSRVILGAVLIKIILINPIIQNMKDRKVFNAQEKRIVIIGKRLEKYENDIENMCREHGIFDIEIKEQKNVTGVSEAFFKKYQRNQIVIDEDKLRALEEKKGEETLRYLRLIVAHELVHIMHRDTPNAIKSRQKMSGIAGILMAIWMVIMVRLKSEIALLYLIGLVGILFLFKIYLDERFWIQIQEIRADVIAMKICNASREVAEEVYRLSKDEDRGEEKNFFYQFYKEHIPRERTLNFERRMKVLEVEKEWGIYYYLWLSWEIIKGLLRKEGFYGK